MNQAICKETVQISQRNLHLEEEAEVEAEIIKEETQEEWNTNRMNNKIHLNNGKAIKMRIDGTNQNHHRIKVVGELLICIILVGDRRLLRDQIYNSQIIGVMIIIGIQLRMMMTMRKEVLLLDHIDHLMVVEAEEEVEEEDHQLNAINATKKDTWPKIVRMLVMTDQEEEDKVEEELVMYANKKDTWLEIALTKIINLNQVKEVVVEEEEEVEAMLLEEENAINVTKKVTLQGNVQTKMMRLGRDPIRDRELTMENKEETMMTTKIRTGINLLIRTIKAKDGITLKKMHGANLKMNENERTFL